MRLSTVAKLISQELRLPEFSALSAPELTAHLQCLKTKGASARVVVVEDAEVLIDPAGVATLCGMFANGQLSAQELAYTADVLLLAECVQFSDPCVAEAWPSAQTLRSTVRLHWLGQGNSQQVTQVRSNNSFQRTPVHRSRSYKPCGAGAAKFRR
jgi:hypothetical protein